MSGPIIRKYGFPNFDQIFGKRDLEHGADETPVTGEPGKDKTPETKPAPSEAAAKTQPK